MVGVVVGAYSSVFITSALWYIFGGKKRGVVTEGKAVADKAEA
jgi:SecD/SecF fusion protein